jgi:tetratricopeptide (TPR) repeat protein
MKQKIGIRKKYFVVIILVTCFSITQVIAQPDKTVAAYSRSIEKEKRKDYLGALKCILDLKDSTSYENNLRLGWLYYKAGLEKKSLTYYGNAISINPKAIEPKIGFRYPAALVEDFTHLIEQDKKILDIDPNNKSTNSNLALIYNYNKEYAKAIPHLQKVIKHYPFDYDNNLALAWAYLQSGKNNEAEKHFNIVLLYAPADPSAIEGLENLGKPTGGYTQLMPAFVKSYELSSASDYKGAAQAIKDSYDKSSYFVNLRLAWLLHLAGLELESITYYKIANELAPLSIEAKLGLAIPTEALGNKNELKSIFESILILDPENTYVNYKLGLLYYQKKEYETALKYLEKVVTLYPFDYDGVILFAWINYYANRYEEARKQFYKALCLSPGDQSATLGLTYKPLEEQRKLEQKDIIIPK